MLPAVEAQSLNHWKVREVPPVSPLDLGDSPVPKILLFLCVCVLWLPCSFWKKYCPLHLRRRGFICPGAPE